MRGEQTITLDKGCLPSLPSTFDTRRYAAPSHPCLRFPKLPTATSLGITYHQRTALARIRRLEAEILDQASLWDVKLVEPKLEALQALIEEHFPTELSQVAARQELERMAQEANQLAS